jgi:hypothetical protein
VVAAIKAAAPPDLTARVFGAFSYHKAQRTSDGLVEATLDAAGLDGVDLHGDETVQSITRFAEVFAEARRRGLLVKAHAGELAGPASVSGRSTCSASAASSTACGPSRTPPWWTGWRPSASRSTCARGRT